ncbi:MULTISPECIES: group II intron reverse transcriptase/maturase [unclassified Streptomyces]|uniref:group II intron reverse transcriptase/maturase n=1 Tax=unclassified Streptomyces TaxID=2593676 RepID=UPI0029B6EE09|nr:MULTISPECIES: group II intron reverse transcriptase/maturase [unclassified Streptomyces]MDX3772438.1 group II intron reverse transcriptase/maturase [Streptomyces sp. AK08-01B]MDX3821895.1 group II intron reverse transcriptase/maturase [Streptomyces sp. AK08-01A]
MQIADRAASALPAASVPVNGPEGEDLDWASIDWRRVEENVRRLRQRIFTASQAGDLKKVRNLQKLMLRSRSNTLLSVRRVTEINAGRATAGVDGKVVLLSRSKAALAHWVQHRARPWIPKPVKRVFIPKPGTVKKRGLGIPVIVDRCLQAAALGALEPEWEARFEPKSYGFRPGRGCHDAIGAIYSTLNGKNPQRTWVLDADLTAAFDRIDHARIMAALGTFPARGLVRQWLKAGVVDRGRFAPTEEGTPQGGVISPLLFNLALHGMEEAAGVRYYTAGRDAGSAQSGSPVLVRYADDFVALCTSREQAEQVKERLAAWLTPRGLAFHEDKTRIVHAETGFDFLGFNVRRYHGKLLIKPSEAAQRRIRERLSIEMVALRGANAGAVLKKINPIVRGWSAYYRTAVSSEIFTALENHMWKLAYKWAKHSHPNKPKHWVSDKYFGRFNRSRNDRWVFGDRDSGAYLLKFTWTKIVRHQLVKGKASPDDPSLESYWAQRRRKGTPLPVDAMTVRLLQAQRGRCSICGGLLLHADHPPQSPQEWETWRAVIRKAISKQHIAFPGESAQDGQRIRLLHTQCQRRNGAAAMRSPASLSAGEPLGLA